MTSGLTGTFEVKSLRRERRLWACAIIVVAAIYSTLGLTSTLMEVISDRRVFDRFFIAGFLLIWVAVLTEGLTVRPKGIEIGLGLAVGAVLLMVFARMGIPERTHLFEYGVVAVLIYEALLERRSRGHRVPAAALLAIAVAWVIGLVDECVQYFIPSRVFDVVDIGFNGLAAASVVCADIALRWVRNALRKLLSVLTKRSESEDS